MNYYNCIYMYVNKINGKRYIGLTIDFNRRYNEHLKYNTQLIDKAIDKYGIDNFDIIILAHDIQTKEQMNNYEEFFIKRYNTLAINGKGYNIAIGGQNCCYWDGYTEEQKEATKQKIREANLGKELPQETKDKISKKVSGELNPMYGTVSYWKGKELPQETKDKISNSLKGKTKSEEHKKNLSISRKNKKQIVCVNTGQVFESITEATRWTGQKSKRRIQLSCQDKERKITSGVHPETGEKLKWMYLKDYEN